MSNRNRQQGPSGPRAWVSSDVPPSPPNWIEAEVVPPPSPDNSQATPSSHESSSPQSTVSNAESSFWRAIPNKLKLVDQGKVVQRLEVLRQEAELRSPEEMYLLLNPTEIGDAVEVQFAQKARKLEGWRNIFVLVPLMITWVSLGLAGIAFIESIHANSRLTAQSFFSLWIDGFPDLRFLQIGPISIPFVIAGWHLFTFGGVTILDFMLLLLVVWLTWRMHRVDNQAHQDAIALSTWLREEFDQLCKTSRVRSLGPGPENKRPQWAVEVHTAIQSLHEVLDNVQEATGKSQESFVETIDRFTDTYQQQNQAVNSLIKNTQEVEVAVDNLKTIFGRSEHIYQHLEQILPQIDQQITSLANQQESAARALQSIATEITTASQAIRELALPFAAHDLANMADTMRRNMQYTTNQQRETMESLERMEERLTLLDLQKGAGNTYKKGFWNRLFNR